MIAISLFIILALVVPFLIFHKAHSHDHPSDSASFTPSKPLSQQATTEYSGVAHALSFSYPTAWKNVSDPGSDTVTLAYTVDGATYHLNISPPGQINPEGEQGLSYANTTPTYAGREYTRTVWSVNGAPFYVTAIPQQLSSTQYYVLSMDLPSKDTSQYLSVFDQIANTLTYN